MAQDRLFHKRLGHGERINHLTDFEYIVWGCYVLSADDFGVMRLSAVTLQADHDRLAKKAPGAIERALNRAVETTLLMKFEHQTRRYVFQPDWQDYQKIRFPARSTNPLPPPDLLAKCTAAQQGLFGTHAAAIPKPIRGIPEVSPKLIGGTSEVPPKSLRKNVNSLAELPHGNANANGNAHGNGSENGNGNAAPKSGLIVSDELAARAGRFVDRYAELYAEHRHGARLLRRQPALDWDRACQLCDAWDDARLEQLAVIFLESDDEWIAKTDRGLGVFASRASWCDARLAAHEAKHGRLT